MSGAAAVPVALSPQQWKLLERYWLRKLAGANPKVALETRGDRYKSTLPVPPALYDSAANKAGGSELGIFTLFASAAAVALARSLNVDSVLGATVSFDNLRTGPAGNPLLLRVAAAAGSSFRQVFEQVKRDLLEAINYQTYPFETLVAKLHERHQAIDSEPVAVALSCPALQTGGAALEGFPFRIELSTGAAPALHLSCAAGDGGSMAERWARRVLTILEDGLRHPDRACGHLMLADEGEEREVRDTFHRRIPAAPFRSVYELFEETAGIRPDALAVAGEDEHLTYSALRGRAMQVATALAREGIGAEDVVAVAAPYSSWLVSATLGVLHRGAAFVLIPPSGADARTSYLLADSGTTVVLRGPGVDIPAGVHGKVIDLADLPPASWMPAAKVDESSLAYLIYSSGSTGQPKAAMVEHGAFSEFTTWAAREYGHREGYRTLLSNFAGYDGTILQMFPPLATGGTAFVIDPQMRLDVPWYLRYLRLHRIQCIDETPVLLKELCRHQRWSKGLPLDDLEMLSVGGEECPIELVRECRALLVPNGAIVNGYSPSETSPIVLTHHFDGRRDGEVSLLGRPRPNTSVLLLNNGARVLPVGVPGEIHVAGRCVSRGYRNRSGLTAERFVPSIAGDGGRMYRSGDVGCWDTDGNIAFRGRADRQVKIRAHRVELDEIEQVLRGLPEVQQAAVTFRPDSAGGRLIAYIEPARGERAELWPPLGDYLAYDDLAYDAMTNDRARNDAYLQALRPVMKGRVAVDVGTGRDAVLATLCIEAGARHVYAIEQLDDAYRGACRTVQRLGLADRITVLQGNAMEIDLPEKADVCVSEVFGAIAGSEGAAAILNQAKRFLTADGVVIPACCTTLIAAATLPDELHTHPCFGPVAYAYVEKIFAGAGRRFDFPVGVRSFPPSLVLSNTATFEVLDFRRHAELPYQRRIELQIEAEGRLDGFILWLVMETAAGVAFDTLHDRHCWIPVFLPVFWPGVRVCRGDRIEAVCRGALSQTGPLPAYHVAGTLIQEQRRIEFSHHVSPDEQSYRGTPFYQRLFSERPAAGSPDGDRRLLVHRICEQLAGVLPDFMIPTSLEVVDRLPMLDSRKVDYLALPDPSAPAGGPDDRYLAPRSRLEEILASIWGEVLGFERVGIDDHFFECGGHSLSAMQAISRIRQTLRIEISVRDLFENPTVNGLARRIEIRADGQGVPGLSGPFEARAPHGLAPLSFAQQRLWFLSSMLPDSAVYVAPALLSLRGNVDRAALERALNEIVKRHEILRTAFVFQDGRPVQRILPELQVPLRTVDLSHLGPVAAEERAGKLCREGAREGFDLTTPPLLRATLFSIGETEQRLLVTLHHIICDGWSIGLLLGELSTLYAAGVRGEEAPLPTLRLQYADFSVWQRQALESGSFEEQRRYWKSQLEGIDGMLQFPADRPRPAVSSFAGGTLSFQVPPATARELAALGGRHGATLFMTLLAAFNVLLFRYTGRTDLPVGFPIANRNRSELEGLIGFFANTLVLRARVSGSLTFSELLADVRQMALDAYANQDFPFENLVQELQPERDPSYQPLFQIAFAHLGPPIAPPVLPGVEAAVVELDTQTAKFDLYLAITGGVEELTGVFEYSRDLFDDSTIERLRDNFLGLLHAIVERPEASLAELPVVCEQERAFIVDRWNQTACDEARQPGLQALFERQALARPDAIAVAHGVDQVTYAALNAWANAIAYRLIESGVGPEVVVGIQMERSEAAVAAMLGVLKCGAAFVSLDTRYPQERLAFILGHAKPRLILTEAVRDWRTSAALPNPPECAAPDGLAYIVYTSGTTGRPKGIQMTYASLLNQTAWQVMENRERPPLRTLQFASMNFDMAYLEAYSTLCDGGTLVIGTEDARRDGKALLDCMRDGGVERVYLPSPAVQRLAAAASAGVLLPRLRFVASSAEELRITPEVAALFRDNPDGALANFYGPSECEVVTALPLPPDCREWPARPPIGRPILNSRIYVLDRNLRAVPMGATGEIWIGGIGVARGYLNEPGLTAWSFRADPFACEPGTRMYKTGDLGRHRSDGNLQFLGRIDRQIKIRGVRIEPAEIESALGAHPAVRAVYVMAADLDGSTKLCCYVVPRSAAPATQDLRDFLRQKLPEYMQPSVYVMVPELLLDTNGKVDRKRLPQPQAVRRATHYTPPATHLQAELAAIWQETLAIQRVGLHDNFFDLGGDSILIAQVHNRIREKVDAKIRVVDLFQHPTIEALAEFLAGSAAVDGDAEQSEPRAHLAGARKDARQRRMAARRQLAGESLEEGSSV